ncbi:hypothetical protein BY458DRAFT_493776 [Sporodiniella umbellata]|nr:hypothetical protein BY458DRAFT_493776 [Sporodiniella umbellata]
MYTLNTQPFPALSRLSKSDQSFIEFTRCLYKAKSIMLELQTFSKTVGPSLYRENKINPEDFVHYVRLYLDGSIRKFNQLCKVLLAVLSRLESNQAVRKERIHSFRQEVLDEWKKASGLKQDLYKLTAKQKQCLDDAGSLTSSSESTAPTSDL